MSDNKPLEDRFIKLLQRVEDPELKSDFLKCYFEMCDKIEQAEIKSRGCMPCISNCTCNCEDNEIEICNGNDVDANIGQK